jgi:2-haloacid dehalogenase
MRGDELGYGNDRYNAAVPATHNCVAIFDLGGVVIDWNPRYLYRKLFNGNETAMEDFLATVCTSSWNAEQDAGRLFVDGCDSLKRLHPDKAELIDAWFQRYEEMLGGEIPGAVDILKGLRSRSVPIYALSNWSAETFPIALNRFECLSWFNGVLLSGEVKVLKPDRRIFEIFLDTFRIEPSRGIYIDDRRENVEAAIELGMRGVVFTDSRALRAELTGAGLLVD